MIERNGNSVACMILLSLFVLVALSLTACGDAPTYPGPTFCDIIIDGKAYQVHCLDGESVTIGDGVDGIDGVDGEDAPTFATHETTTASVRGACYPVAPGVWVENEGSHADVYNNDDCAHGPSPKGVYCNDIYEGDNCPVGNIIVYIEDSYSDMIIHVLEFK